MTERWGYVVALPLCDYYNEEMWRRVFPPSEDDAEMRTGIKRCWQEKAQPKALILRPPNTTIVINELTEAQKSAIQKYLDEVSSARFPCRLEPVHPSACRRFRSTT